MRLNHSPPQTHSLWPVTVKRCEVEIPFSTHRTTHRSSRTNYTSSTTSSTTPTCCSLPRWNSDSGCRCPRSAHSLMVTAFIPFIEKEFLMCDECMGGLNGRFKRIKHLFILTINVYYNKISLFIMINVGFCVRNLSIKSNYRFKAYSFQQNFEDICLHAVLNTA